jgi:hypothetical protein
VLAQRLGQFLRTCPGLNKTTVGELLGEVDPFYLDVSTASRQMLMTRFIARFCCDCSAFGRSGPLLRGLGPTACAISEEPKTRCEREADAQALLGGPPGLC